MLNELHVQIADTLSDLDNAQIYSKVFVKSQGTFYYYDEDDLTWKALSGSGGSLIVPISISDGNDTVTANYTPFGLNIDYNGEAALPTTLVSLGIASRITYGDENDDTQGTLHCFTSTFDVVKSEQSNSEMANWMGWQRFKLGAGVLGRAWYGDFSLLGSDEQQEQLNGITMLVNNYFDGSPINGPSCAFVAVSAQGKGAGGEDGHNSAQTYPVNIGFAVVGHSGIPGGGGEDRGFDYGFKVGRNASGWMVPTEESLVGVGFQADGYDTAAFVIGQPGVVGNTPGLITAVFDGGGTINYSHIIDFNNTTAANIGTGGSCIRLPNINDAKAGILFGGSGTRLRVGSNNDARIDGFLSIGGNRSGSNPLTVVIASPGTGVLVVGDSSPINGLQNTNTNGGFLEFGIASASANFSAQANAGDSVIRARSVSGGTGNLLILNVNSSGSQQAFVFLTGALDGDTEKFRITKDGIHQFLSTVTGSGVTGSQEINKASGTVNFAAAASSLVVTNNLCTENSIVLCVVRTNDSMAQIKNVVPANGSFTIRLSAAANAETSVGFLVINQ